MRWGKKRDNDKTASNCCNERERAGGRRETQRLRQRQKGVKIGHRTSDLRNK